MFLEKLDLLIDWGGCMITTSILIAGNITVNNRRMTQPQGGGKDDEARSVLFHILSSDVSPRLTSSSHNVPRLSSKVPFPEHELQQTL